MKFFESIKSKNKALLLCSALFFFAVSLSAQIPTGYYDSAFNKKERVLKTALYNIIKGHTVKSYDFLYTIYETSDVTADGKVWDMYSSCTWIPGQKKCGNYSTVCDCYNREHSIPQSWFSEKSPMVSDAFHLYPTDGRVNGQRSNYPFGECADGKNLGGKALGKLGKSTFLGYSGTVFEPVDEYKGDFARTYFYFATRYEDIMTSINGESFNKTVYPAFPTWTINLFIKWHRQDPVSQKEIDRNNAVYAYQHNRNPYIDYPQLAEYVWGDSISYAFDPNNPPVTIETIEPVFAPVAYTFSGALYLEELPENAIIRIYNLMGQKLHQAQSDTGSYLCSLPERNQLYIIQIQNKQGNTITLKLINN